MHHLGRVMGACEYTAAYYLFGCGDDCLWPCGITLRSTTMTGSSDAQSFSLYGWLVVVWILVTPFQYGYHISALNQIQAALTCSNEPPAIDGLPACIQMSDLAFSLVTSVFTIGGLVGSSVSNLITDSRGRRGALRLGAVFTTVGAGVMGASSSVAFLAFGR